MSFLFNNFAFLYDSFMHRTGLAGEKRLLGYFGDVKGRKVADIGGGTGSLAQLLNCEGAFVTIIDPSRAMTRIAKEKIEAVTIINSKAEKLPLPDAEFDLACMKDCLHHIKSKEEALREVTRVVKPGGKLFILEFDPGHMVGKLVFLLERLAFEKTSLIKPTALVELCRKYGVEGRTEHLNPFEYIFVGYKYGEGTTIL